jgi:hypothetical protein
MAVVVVGGHSRNVGKTSVVAGLISALRDMHWTAIKITQYGHGICSADGGACDCATDDHSWAITEESDQSGESDSSRFLLAGAERSWWVRTQQGRLAEAMPQLRAKLTGNVILESNSVMKFLRPDVYLAVLDCSTEDFKRTALEFLDRADAILMHEGPETPQWKGVSLKLIEGKPTFRIVPPDYVPSGVAEFVKSKITKSELV